jgi:MFS family permease
MDSETSSIQSFDSNEPINLHSQEKQKKRRLSTNIDNNNYNHSHNHNHNLLTRTSTIISNIKEDNKFAKTQVEPNPSFDPNDLIKIGTAAPPEHVISMIQSFSVDSKIDIEKQIEETERNNEKSIFLKDTGEYNRFDVENKPPDKGFWAWIAVVCVMCINTFSWGLNACFGVYLNYYTTLNYFPGATMEQYVMIGGLGLGLSFMACTITNALCRRIHYKIIMAIGTAITFLSYWLASIAKTVVQLIMFQGLLMAIGWALVAGSTFVILPTWFLKKRSIAQGIATAGGGLGGIIFARPIDQIIKLYMNKPEYIDNPNEGLRQGMAWALRMEAIVCGFMLSLSILLIKTYRPLKDESGSSKPFIIEMFSFLTRFDLIRQLPIFCLILWNVIYGLTYTILLFSLSSYATSIGLSYKQGSNVTTVQSVAQTVGRPLLGFMSDKIGRVNATVLATTIIVILVFFFWIFVTTYSQLLAFGFLIGLFLGVNWVNFGPMTADVVGGGGIDLNHAISIQMFAGSLPLFVAELIGLKLKRTGMSRPFLYCQLLVGVAAVISVLLLMPLREWKVKRILLARRNLLKYKLDNFNEQNESSIESVNSNEDKNIENDNDINSIDNINYDQIDSEIQRYDKMLENSAYSYLIRMFYPIAV